ncbi:hypothetical protein B0T14DRAFT_500752 [Immersiella caudata]|uniref:Uncharacterized protein n=1 Tax=Immersiella caudata TaxID=314043 RepID=A0AA39W4J0_9PEZI|nr:hypothetical protein B0T14DRAFT_500752 [Immersiella caudata]
MSHNAPADQLITTLDAHKVEQDRTPGKWQHSAFTVTYLCAGRRFEILVTDNPPPECDRDGALEAGWARTTDDVCFHNSHGTRNEDRHREFLAEIAETIKDIVRPSILQMVQSPGSETVKLQLVTQKGAQLVIPGHHLGAGTSTSG